MAIKHWVCIQIQHELGLKIVQTKLSMNATPLAVTPDEGPQALSRRWSNGWKSGKAAPDSEVVNWTVSTYQWYQGARRSKGCTPPDGLPQERTQNSECRRLELVGFAVVRLFLESIYDFLV